MRLDVSQSARLARSCGDWQRELWPIHAPAHGEGDQCVRANAERLQQRLRVVGELLERVSAARRIGGAVPPRVRSAARESDRWNGRNRRVPNREIGRRANGSNVTNRRPASALRVVVDRDAVDGDFSSQTPAVAE